ncbi:hypothetical protein GCM10027082_15470 [Comamonas humi]
MRWSHLRKWAISLPAAFLAAAILIGINEIGYFRSHQALETLNGSFHTRTAIDKLLQQIVDAETGVRGYLLTSDNSYLDPYKASVTNINSTIDNLRKAYGAHSEDQLASSRLGLEVSKKIAELDMSIQLHDQGFDGAWKYIISHPSAQDNMDSIRQLARQLVEHSDNQRATNEAEIVRSLMLARLGIAIVTVIGLIAFYLYLRQSGTLTEFMIREQKSLEQERDRLEALVRERTATLGELATHLQQVREDERAHLARELHDELGALLTAAKLDVARLKSRVDMQSVDVADRIKHLTDTLNSGIALKRRIIEDLRPSSLSNLGLAASLEILTEEFAKSSNITVDLNMESMELAEATELTIYRLVQESLTNIGKYAQARNVLVNVQNYPSHIAIQVRDDGVGFDAQQVRPSSHGLAGMKHRVEAAGGRLTVASVRNQGTQITAVLPHDSAKPVAASATMRVGVTPAAPPLAPPVPPLP